MLCHPKLQYHCNIHIVIFERDLKNISPWILRFCTRTPDDDRFRSKHVAFRHNNLYLCEWRTGWHPLLDNRSDTVPWLTLEASWVNILTATNTTLQCASVASFCQTPLFCSVWSERWHDSLQAGWSGNWMPVGGEIFLTRRNRPWGPPSLPDNGYGVFPRSK